MKSCLVTRDIDADPDKVWSILTDARRLQNGFGISRIEGEIARGQTIKLWSEVNPGRAFTLRVVVADKPWFMVRTGGMPFGLIKGIRKFRLAPLADRRTEFTMVEEFSGPLMGVFGRSIPDQTAAFAIFADRLRQVAEA